MLTDQEIPQRTHEHAFSTASQCTRSGITRHLQLLNDPNTNIMHWQVEALLARRMRTLLVLRASLILCWSLVLRKDNQSRTQQTYLTSGFGASQKMCRYLDVLILKAMVGNSYACTPVTDYRAVTVGARGEEEWMVFATVYYFATGCPSMFRPGGRP